MILPTHIRSSVDRVKVGHARKRIAAVIDEIERLKQSEFPYTQPLDALSFLQEKLKHLRSLLDKTSSASDPVAVDNACKESLARLYEYIPLLGFLLRSTNVRNAFESYGPLLRLAKLVLQDNINLILSSEWHFSPRILFHRRYLPGFILIGLPAPESSNPLLVPLAGHELGHSVWDAQDYLKKFDVPILDDVLKEITDNRWKDYHSIHPELEKEHVTDLDVVAWSTFSPAYQWAERQIEEIFCDCFALRLFDKAYLQAFAYILSPGMPKRTNANYPEIGRRAYLLELAAKEMEVSVPENFVYRFGKQSSEWDRATQLLVDVADSVSASRVSDLIQLAVGHADERGVPRRDADNVAEIYDEFRVHMVPTTRPQSLVDVLNAAWKCAVDLHLWDDKIPYIRAEDWDRILADLVLKSMEVAEFHENPEM